jgi:hypothetical protein
MKEAQFALILAVTALVMCGCMALRQESDGVISPSELLAKSAEAMKGVTSYHFVGGFELQTYVQGQAEGDHIMPDTERLSMDATGRGKTDMIRIGSERYTRRDDNLVYRKVPLQMFEGWMPAPRLINDIRTAADVTIVGEEKVDNIEAIHLKFTYDGRPNVQFGPADITGFEESELQIWIDKATFLVHRYAVSARKGQPFDTVVTFSRFNQTVSPPIEEPKNIAAP